MSRARLTLLLAAALALTVSSLGATAAPATSAAQAAVTVSMQGNLYLPDAIVIAAGTTVVWSNDEYSSGEAHDVVAADGSFASAVFGVGRAFEYTFWTPGTYNYYCTLHEGMYGVVYVE
jgi:plastocyanin